ncbi:MAG: HAD-IB family hydrolase [Verrucomicrobia bacterium]|nr:HAD-IB family hydrolase [Verrucomicrobiota bacterium]
MTTGDSLGVFLREVTSTARYFLGLIILSPRLLQYALGLIPDWQVKELVLTHFLGGWCEERLRAAAEKFAADELPKLVKPAALERLRWHQQQKHRTILISGSPALYLGPWAAAAGFDDVSATHLAFERGKITGRILGKNCVGPEKVERLVKLLGDLSRYYIYAYGDSRGDKELLARANRAYYRPF